MLNIVDGGVLQIDPADPTRHPKDLKLEVDHIFPRSKLVEAGLGDVADHLGNYRLIVMPAKGAVSPMRSFRRPFAGDVNWTMQEFGVERHCTS
jgi:hypothetical protein